jgi:bifunctional non-homologous end joining protein LigD
MSTATAGDTVVRSVRLECRTNGSDKVYHIKLLEVEGGYEVHYSNGPRLGGLTHGVKTKAPVSLAEAEKVFDKLQKEKIGKSGYTPVAGDGSYVAPVVTVGTGEQMAQLLNDTPRDEAERLLADPSWGVQEKKDGKHLLLLVQADGSVAALNKKGLPCGYPDCFSVVSRLPAGTLLDGEGIGETFHVFDVLEHGHDDARALPYRQRYALASQLVAMVGDSCVRIVPFVTAPSEKLALFERAEREGREGVVFKRIDATHRAGRPASGGDMRKLKFRAEATVRVAAEGRADKRSVGLEVRDEQGQWVNVGNVTIPGKQDIPVTGAIIEVIYLYAYRGGALFQPVFKEVRTDADESDCQIDQLKFKVVED